MTIWGVRAPLMKINHGLAKSGVDIIDDGIRWSSLLNHSLLYYCWWLFIDLLMMIVILRMKKIVKLNGWFSDDSG